MTPGDYGDLIPEPVTVCVWRGSEYRRHETWGDSPQCLRCGRIVQDDDETG